MLSFDALPAPGHAIRVKTRRRLRWLRFTHAEPYVRKSDSAQTFILHWLDDHGYRYTSGLRSKSVTLLRHVEQEPRP
jgi:hypothetical protein